MTRWSLALAVLVAATSTRSAVAQQAPAEATFLAWGRQFTEWLYAGQGDSLYAHLDAASQQEVGAPQALAGFSRMIAEQGGEEFALASEQLIVGPDGRSYRYLRRVHLTKVPDLTVLVHWVLGPDGKIRAFGIDAD